MDGTGSMLSRSLVSLPKDRTVSTRSAGSFSLPLPPPDPDSRRSFRRATESIFRSLNNLLERFHQSFFLYIMTSVDSFIAVGNYLAAPIITGIGLTITGFIAWVEAGKASKGGRQVAKALTVVGVAGVAGATEMMGLLAIDLTKEAPVRPHLLLFLS